MRWVGLFGGGGGDRCMGRAVWPLRGRMLLLFGCHGVRCHGGRLGAAEKGGYVIEVR